MRGDQDKPIETIRLSEDQTKRLIDHVNQAYHKPVPQERRDVRVPYAVHRIVATVTHPNGSQTRHVVLPRNLSRGGISFMIGRFIYPDCEAMVQLPDRAGNVKIVHGRTLRCNHFEGMIHECAIVFGEPIELDRFVEPAAVNAASQPPGASPDVTPLDVASAAGERPSVLIVDDLKNDRRLFGLWLLKLGFQSIEAESASEALDALDKNPVEIALVNVTMERAEGEGLLRQMRDANFSGPVLAVSCDDNPALRTTARAAGADEYLVKPFDQLDLKRSIERLLAASAPAADHDDAPIRSELAGNDAMQPLLREFVSGLGDTAQKLSDADAQKDRDAIVSLCRHLKGSGNGYGFPQITQLALLVLDQLEIEQQDAGALNRSVDELTSLLRRVRAD